MLHVSRGTYISLFFFLQSRPQRKGRLSHWTCWWASLYMRPITHDPDKRRYVLCVAAPRPFQKEKQLFGDSTTDFNHAQPRERAFGFGRRLKSHWSPHSAQSQAASGLRLLGESASSSGSLLKFVPHDVASAKFAVVAARPVSHCRTGAS